MNEGLKQSKVNDEIYTPKYAVIPLLKYLDKSKKIICPFDTQESNFYKVLKSNGYDVTALHMDDGKDFFLDFFDHYDIIISNPPYSIKDEVLERLYLIGKPFIMLLPLTTLSSGKRVPMFIKNGLEVLIFDKRIGYNINGEQKDSNWFASAYFCHNILPEKLIFEILEKD
jgi:hypothetical protein